MWAHIAIAAALQIGSALVTVDLVQRAVAAARAKDKENSVTAEQRVSEIEGA